MNFEWDENKRVSNLLKHGLDFVDAETIFGHFTLTIIDERFDYGEERYFTLGKLSGRCVALSHTIRKDSVRVISFRKANRNEQEKYESEIANRLGPS